MRLFPVFRRPRRARSVSYRRFAAILKSAAVFAALAAPPPLAAEPARLLLLGDSLVAGYGLAPGEAFPAQLRAALRERGVEAAVLDGGVSGDTSAGGLARVGWMLADGPTHALVELGANDALRGIDPAVTRANLDRLLARLRAAGVRVLLAGMYAPPNWGREYGTAFRRIYPELAERHGSALYPFFLDGVAAEPGLNQRDGIHPNARGVAVIVRRILPHVLRLLDADG